MSLASYCCCDTCLHFKTRKLLLLLLLHLLLVPSFICVPVSLSVGLQLYRKHLAISLIHGFIRRKSLGQMFVFVCIPS